MTEQENKAIFKGMAKERMHQLAEAFNSISKAKPTTDNVPMTEGKYVIEVNEDYYNLLAPFMKGFVTRSYKCENFEGEVEEVICNCTFIRIKDKNYLAFLDKTTFHLQINNLIGIINDYFNLHLMKYMLDGDDGE